MGDVTNTVNDKPVAARVNPLARFQASLRRHGLFGPFRAAGRHVRAAFVRFRDRGFDSRWRTDTAAFVEIPEMTDVRSEHLARGIRYEPTQAIPLRRFLTDVRPDTTGTFVDIGCGKGRALIIAAEYGFSSVVGVDFSTRLCEVARENLLRYRSGADRDVATEIVCADAVIYPFAPDQTTVFMYNPFDAVVMARALDNLAASLAAAPRDITLIYHNPVCHDLIVSRGTFRVVLRKSYGACPLVAYRTR